MGPIYDFYFKSEKHDRLPHLGREITVLLILKFIALAILFLFFFGPAQRLTVSSDTIQKHLLSSPEKTEELSQ